MCEPECNHENIKPDVWDHALVVCCADCGEDLGHCWGSSHVSEQLWNRACKGHEEDFNPCEQSRADVCVCGIRVSEHGGPDGDGEPGWGGEETGT